MEKQIETFIVAAGRVEIESLDLTRREQKLKA